MGREQRRKEAKKNRNRVIEKDNVEENSIKGSTLLKIIFSIALILLVLYYILAVFVTKEVDISGNKDDNTKEEATTSNKILASNTFRQSPAVYYVYFYDFTDEDEEVSNVVSNYSEYTIYKVNTKDGMNSKYVVDSGSNKEVQDIDGLKVVNNTLIKIDNDKVVGYFEGTNDIIKELS